MGKKEKLVIKISLNRELRAGQCVISVPENEDFGR